MTNPVSMQNRFLALSIQVCADCSAALGLAALVGWISGYRWLASLGSLVPMAPITALLFLCFGIALSLEAGATNRPSIQRFTTPVAAAGTLIALTVGLLSYFDIHLKIEHLGIPISGSAAGVPIGFMSPLTAMCFVLAGVSLLSSGSAVRARRRNLLSLAAACLLFAIGFVLLMAYLFGRPILYGGPFIPPALSTSLAFAVLSAALSLQAGRRVWEPVVIHTDHKKTTWMLAGVFSVVAIGVVVGGYFYFKAEEHAWRGEVEGRLSAVADLKVEQMKTWKHASLRAALYIHRNTERSGMIKRYLDRPSDLASRNSVETWMIQLRNAFDHDRVSLFDASARERLRFPSTPDPIDSHLTQWVREDILSGQIRFHDFYRDGHSHKVYLDESIPILDEHNAHVIAVLVLRVDPSLHLYPMLERWPVPSRTAETFLVRRDGTDMQFASNLRFVDNAALNLRRPLTDTLLPAVKAVLGFEGIADGTDYRGRPVLAAARRVPDSPWYLIARMDISEVYEPMRGVFWRIVVFAGILLFGAAAAVGPIWRHQRARFFEQQFRTADALRASKERFSKAFHSRHVFMAITDLNGRFVDVNEFALGYLGYLRGEIVGRTHKELDLFVDESADGIERALREKGSVHNLELPLRASDGSLRYGVLSAETIDVEGEPYRLFILTDATARKRAEEKLDVKEELLHLTGEMAKVGGWEFDPRTGNGTWSDEVARIHDLDPSLETNAQLGLSVYSGEHLARIEKAVREAVENAQSYDLILEMTSAKGVRKWVRTIGIPVVKDNKVVKVHGTFQDITDLKRAEEQVRKLNRVYAMLSEINQAIVRIRDRQELFDQVCRIAVEHGGFRLAWIGMLDETRRLRCAARAGQTGDYLDALHISTDGEPVPYCPIDLALRSGQPSICNVIGMEEPVPPCKTMALELGFRSTVSLPIKVFENVPGTVNLYSEEPGVFDEAETKLLTEMVMDVSFALENFAKDADRKKAEEDRVKLEEQLRQAQKMESIGRLAGGVAHDFNNLLTVITGYAAFLKSEMKPTDPLVDRVEQIHQAAEHAAALTRQLLAFSRKQVLAPAAVDLNKLIVNLSKMLSRVIGEDISLTTVLQPGLRTVTVDPGQTEQVIMNLVVNARDAMPTGGKLTIETGHVHLDEGYLRTHPEAPRGDCVMLAVTDTGYGMDKATLSHIFEPFFTTKESGKGTGLGLSMVYGIVKQSGGDIFVHSEPGHGTTFKIYFPVYAATPDQRPMAGPRPRVRKGTETILLVEDEESVRKLIAMVLRQEGYSVLEASRGAEALEMCYLHEGPLDLLLTDVVMPGMSGRELAEGMQKRFPALRVIFMSGYTDDSVVRHGLLTAEIEYLPKPFSPDSLTAKVRYVLDK